MNALEGRKEGKQKESEMYDGMRKEVDMMGVRK